MIFEIKYLFENDIFNSTLRQSFIIFVILIYKYKYKMTYKNIIII